MFESAEIGHSIDKETYDAAVPELREALLQAQYRLKAQARFPVLILINGIEGAGKGETIKLLNEWMDPRLIRADNFDVPSDEELSHPLVGDSGVGCRLKGIPVFSSATGTARCSRTVCMGGSRALSSSWQLLGRSGERMLCDDGMLIFKFWFHLSKEQMNARLDSLKNDPLHSWRISSLDWQQSKTYDKFVRHGEKILRLSSRDFAPWYVIEGWTSAIAA